MESEDEIRMRHPHPKEIARAQELYEQGHRAKIRQIPAEDVFPSVTQYALLVESGMVYVWNDSMQMPPFVNEFLAPEERGILQMSAWVVFRALQTLFVTIGC